MTLAPLAALLLSAVGAGPDADPSALVARLGSPRYADRRGASDDLEKLGRRAVNALRAARAVDDAEVRSRAEMLLEKIEVDLLTRPTLVTLEGRGRPLGEVVRDLAIESGTGLVLDRELAEDSGRRVDVRGDRPIPFWSAIERLGLAPRTDIELASGPRVPSLGLGLPENPRRAEVRGPFRLELRGPDLGAGELVAYVDVLAEPRLMVKAEGTAHLLEAIDDRGQSLLMPSRDARFVAATTNIYALPDPPMPRASVPIRLRQADRPGKVLKRLKGYAVLTISARKPEPLILSIAPIENASGKSFTVGDHTFTIQGVRSDPETRRTSIELLVLPLGVLPEPFARGGRGNRRGWQQGDNRSVDATRLCEPFEVVDARGNTLKRFATTTRNGFQAGTRLTLSIEAGRGEGPPAEIRYDDYVRTTTEVPFEFKDVPMP